MAASRFVNDSDEDISQVLEENEDSLTKQTGELNATNIK